MIAAPDQDGRSELPLFVRTGGPIWTRPGRPAGRRPLLPRGTGRVGGGGDGDRIGPQGRRARPELARALTLCKAIGAVLVIGKLDRLARDVRFFLEVIDDSGVDISFADLPDV